MKISGNIVRGLMMAASVGLMATAADARNGNGGGPGGGGGGNTTKSFDCALSVSGCLGGTDAGVLSFDRVAVSSSNPYADPKAWTGSVSDYPWMDADIQGAWDVGLTGAGTTLVFVDDFTSGDTLKGELIKGIQQDQTHGFWTSEQAGLIAPNAKLIADDFNTEDPIYLDPTTNLNVVNMSFGWVDRARNWSIDWYTKYPQEESIINHAAAGDGVFAKAAGNDGIQLLQANFQGKADFLNRSLFIKLADQCRDNTGTNINCFSTGWTPDPSAPSGTYNTFRNGVIIDSSVTFSGLFVGALDLNGGQTSPYAPQLAYYSNFPGSDPLIQSHFIVVNVDSTDTGLAGTSFAAPIISGYAAIIGSKFGPGYTGTQPFATTVTNRLLETAQMTGLSVQNTSNTKNYYYGVGQACLSCALAPGALN